jgi:hypothetical protein
MTTVHLVCGFLGSGKTTFAEALAKREGAIRFSIDELYLRLFADGPTYDLNHGAHERLPWHDPNAMMTPSFDLAPFPVFAARRPRCHLFFNTHSQLRVASDGDRYTLPRRAADGLVGRFAPSGARS